MKSAFLENEIVTNIIIGELPGFVLCGDDVQIGWTYKDETFSPPPPPPMKQEELISYTAAKRWLIETGGVALPDGTKIATDRESQSMIGNAVQITTLTGQPIKFKASNGFVELSPEQMTGVALAVAAHVQACFSTEADVCAKIKAKKITTVEQIDAYPWPGDVV